MGFIASYELLSGMGEQLVGAISCIVLDASPIFLAFTTWWVWGGCDVIPITRFSSAQGIGSCHSLAVPIVGGLRLERWFRCCNRGAYPVKKGSTGRYLVDQNGIPFLIAGESPQAMIGNLSEADAELFFANRRSHGFNTVWINLLCATYTGCRADGSTFDGIRPFTVTNDFSLPMRGTLLAPTGFVGLRRNMASW